MNAGFKLIQIKHMLKALLIGGFFLQEPSIKGKNQSRINYWNEVLFQNML